MRADRTRTAAGFTLLELVIVLAIIGLSLAVVLPLLGRSVPGTALNAAATEIRMALRDARITAIAEDRAVAFRGDPGGGYWLDRQYHRLAVARPTDGVRVATVGAVPIAFFPSGGSSGGRVFLDGAAGRRELAVDAVTGHARLVP